MIVLHRFFVVLIVLCVWMADVQADIRLPKIFADNMVLQHGGKINVWGTAEANESLTITLGNKTASTSADAEGKWSTQIDSPENAGGPYTLTIKGAEASVVFENVLLGEVWICSGQSNMEWPVNQSLNADVEAELANYPNIRLFTVQHNPTAEPLTDCHGVISWQPCSEQTVRGFSAVGYFFGRHINRKLKTPVGLINSSFGGTTCEAWTSTSAMKEVESLEPLLKFWESQGNDPRNQNRPGVLYNGMIAPIAPYSVRGTIWYQGESNVGRGAQYATLFPTMIQDWRRAFQNPEMPFYFVQIAPFRYGNHSPTELAELWDAQLKTYRLLDHTGIVVTTDVANLGDIHPKNKQPVGRRLALWALAKEYDVPDIRFSGPIYSAHTVEGDKIKVTFDYTDGGLQAKGGALTHFQICGPDKVFKQAIAQIEGDTVLVSSPEVEEPVAVRFAWDQLATPNLFGKLSGLPASPFRTDNFELQSESRDY